MLSNPSSKYRPFAPVALADRTWPANTITRPPVWCSSDLRDGNQSLIEPMDVARKRLLFDTLVRTGFKEIEVGFPSASQTDFDFVRWLIESGAIPDDVTIQVLTPAREELIRRTFESLEGAPRAIVHLYNATSPAFRRTVFDLDRDGCKALAVGASRLMRQLADQRPATQWRFEYSPETFTATELDFAAEVCNAVIAELEPTTALLAIINLPATVEVSTPNIYADQIEWMHRHLARREAIVLSLHPHNDRGTGVAAAELGLMAGADRVEGCLFGNGERTGNVDIVTLALNLYTQGVHPGLDFSDINEVARVVEHCNQLPIHPRHPYVGDLVFTAFSGSHQDAIKKGLAQRRDGAIWDVPYLPVDPADLGRSYEAVIRVNSQSGKGGIAYLLERDYGVVMPRRLQIEFSQAVQRVTDESGREMDSAAIWEIFRGEYLATGTTWQYVSHRLEQADIDGNADGVALALNVRTPQGGASVLHGRGNGPIDALVHALNCGIRVLSYEERSLAGGSDARAAAFVEVGAPFLAQPVFGVGLHENIATASMLAVLSAANRALARAKVADAA